MFFFFMGVFPCLCAQDGHVNSFAWNSPVFKVSFYTRVSFVGGGAQGSRIAVGQVVV